MNLKLYKKYFIYSTADQISYNLLHGGHEGNVAEWSKALVLETSLFEAWVRIPPLLILLYTIQVSSSCIFSSPELLAPIRQEEY